MKNNEDSNKSFYALLSILFMLPIPLGANKPWAWSFFEIAICTLTIIVVITHWKREKFGFAHYKNAVCLWLILILICAIQIIPLPASVVNFISPTSFEAFASVSANNYYISVDPSQSLISFIKVLSFFCLFVCVLCLINTEKRIRMLLITIVAAGTFQALYGTLEIVFGASTSLVFGLKVENVASGSFIYSNHYANFIMLSLAAAVGLIVTHFENPNTHPEKDNQQSFENTLLNNKLLIQVCIAIMAIGLFMSGSKMGNAAFYVGVVGVGAVAIALIRKTSKALSMMVVNTLIFSLFIISAYFGFGHIKERLSPTSLADATSGNIVQDAYPMIADFPILGSGGGSFYSTFPSYRHMEIGTFYNHMQNDYLQFLIEYGVVGSFILFSIFALSIYKALEALYTRRTSILKGSAFTCLMVFTGMAMHMSVDYPLQSYANGCYFVVFLALSMVINKIKLRSLSQRSLTT